MTSGGGGIFRWRNFLFFSEIMPKRSGDSQAYNALLTLLDDGKTLKKSKKEDRALEPAASSTLQDLTEEFQHVESESDEEIELDEENEGDQKDPFESHFVAPDLESVEVPTKWVSTKIPLKLLGDRSVMQTPDPAYFPEPQLKLCKSIDELKLKYRLKIPFERYNKELSDIQQEFFTPLANYNDIFITNRTWDNYKQYRNASILHILNHIYKVRDRVVRNNGLLAKNSDYEVKDQGFTRPKVLVVLPMRNSAANFVDALVRISGLSQVQNKKRFEDSFKTQSEDLSHKPRDFQHTFKGNTNDLFCLGIKFTRQAVKLYSAFYSCDLIVASPLALRMMIGADGDKKRDYDFLSSIEILYVDQVETMQMQSWDNVTTLAKHMNLMPKESHDTDFSRIRSWYLDGKASLLRQTILISEYATPEMSSIWSRYLLNIQGKLKCRETYKGIMASVGIKIRQVYSRIDCPKYSQDSDTRFKHFTTVVLPSLLRGSDHKGTLVFIPSYFDFVRVRNYMDKNNMSFVTLSEYTITPQISRGRQYFADGRGKMMLYTQRLHFYRRYPIKGCHHIVFYALPDNPTFYREIVRFLARTVIEQGVDPDLLKVTTLYTKWDSLKLERVVGTNRVGPLVEGTNDIYEFN